MTTPVPNSGRRRARQRGSAMLEIALTFMGFILLTVGVMDFAMAVYAYNSCAYSSMSAARWAAVRGSQYSTAQNVPLITQTDVQNYVNTLLVGLDTSRATVTATWSPSHDAGSTVQVQVSYNVLPLSYLGLPQSMQVSSTSAFIISY